jgi:hypothetical protein
MKKIIFGLMLLIVLSLIVLGCQKAPAAAPTMITTEPAAGAETTSAEETEISNQLSEIEDLDQMDDDLEQDINVDELDNLVVE